MINISEVHECKRSKGKIVCISTDNVGNTYCGYCHERVDYSFFEREIGENND